MRTETQYNINDLVTAKGYNNEAIGKITAMLGKETSDPKEEDWYEIKYPDDHTIHVPATEIKPVK